MPESSAQNGAHDSTSPAAAGDIRSVAPAPGSLGACLRAIDRVEQVIDQETSALRQRGAIDLADLNHRKSRGLLELTRAMRGLDTSPHREEVEKRLRPLRSKLEENSALLRRHLEAVQDISSVLSRAIREGESDGTYSADICFIGRTQ